MKVLPRKLNLSIIIVLSVLGSTLLLINTTIVLHDSIVYSDLPAEYRSAITKLEENWHYAALSSNQQDAITQVHKQWQSKGLLPWWGADQLVNPDKQKVETLTNFKRHVHRWGTVHHQRRPVLAGCSALAGFLPLLAYLVIVRWIRWLLNPQIKKSS